MVVVMVGDGGDVNGGDGCGDDYDGSDGNNGGDGFVQHLAFSVLLVGQTLLYSVTLASLSNTS